eukprot:SAG31_NODE_10558_length_1124_cov_10.090732_2_plen_202_part_00
MRCDRVVRSPVPVGIVFWPLVSEQKLSGIWITLADATVCRSTRTSVLFGMNAPLGAEWKDHRAGRNNDLFCAVGSQTPAPTTSAQGFHPSTALATPYGTDSPFHFCPELSVMMSVSSKLPSLPSIEPPAASSSRPARSSSSSSGRFPNWCRHGGSSASIIGSAPDQLRCGAGRVRVRCERIRRYNYGRNINLLYRSSCMHD